MTRPTTYKKYTDESYRSFLTTTPFESLEVYRGISKKIDHRCKVCENIWNTEPRSIVQKNYKCIHCFHKDLRMSIDDVKSRLSVLNWSIVDDSEYKNSYTKLSLVHKCGNVVNTRLETVFRTDCHRKRCTVCEPLTAKKHWSESASYLNRTYSSKIELECCEFLISIFGESDIVLQKPYSKSSRKSADAYIKSIDTFIEISTINKEWYLERILNKRRMVNNFIFVSSIEQLKLFFQQSE